MVPSGKCDNDEAVKTQHVLSENDKSLNMSCDFIIQQEHNLTLHMYVFNNVCFSFKWKDKLRSDQMVNFCESGEDMIICVM